MKYIPWVFACATVGWAIGFGLWIGDEIAARKLESIQYEVLVRPVSNGYVVSLKDINNPYPAIERVEMTAADAGTAVTALLKTPFPKPRWGK